MNESLFALASTTPLKDFCQNEMMLLGLRVKLYFIEATYKSCFGFLIFGKNNPKLPLLFFPGQPLS